MFHDGRLALEHYGEGISAETRFNSYSMVKSLVGALIYHAIAEGKLKGLDATLGEILPGDAGLRQVTIRSLLTMRSGIAFGDGKIFGGESGAKDIEGSHINPFGPMARLHFLGLASIEASLITDGVAEPEFNYQNVNTALLGTVLEVLYRRPLPELLAEKIWLPAGTQPAFWRQAGGEKRVSAYCCLFATARDWVRVGLFLAENGTPEAPFLPEPLWREFLGLEVDYASRREGHYGQHIFQDVLDRKGQPLQGAFTYLMGQNGQILYLMPEQGLVVYRAGEKLSLLHSTLYGAWNSAGLAMR